MNLTNLTPAEGSTKNVKRIGRGQGSGYGGTATKGHKGQQSRSGWSSKKGFEGGQMPLQRRVPKYGFRNINRVEYKGVNVNLLQALSESKKLDKIDKNLNSYQYLKTFDDWTKEMIQFNTKLSRFLYPLVFLFMVAGFWFGGFGGNIPGQDLVNEMLVNT